MARLLSMKHDEALGAVVRFWIWADTNTVDGSVTQVALRDLDALLSVPGLCGALAQVGWLKIDKDNDGIIIPKFERHNGESAKKRALNAERQAKWRNAHVDASVTLEALPEKRREDIKETSAPKNCAASKSVDNSTILESLPLNDGTEFHVRQSLVAELSPLYPAVDVPATVREMKGWLVLNESRRKTKRGVKSFIGKWLQGEQEKHGR